MNFTTATATYPVGTSLILQVFGEMRLEKVVGHTATFGSRIDCPQILTSNMVTGRNGSYTLAGLPEFLVAVLDRDARLNLMLHGFPVRATVLAVRPLHQYHNEIGTILVKDEDGGRHYTIPFSQVPKVVVFDFPADLKRAMASQVLRNHVRSAKTCLRDEADQIRSEMRRLEDQLAELNQAANTYPDVDLVDDGADGDLIEALEDCQDFTDRTGLGIDEMLDLFQADSTTALK